MSTDTSPAAALAAPAALPPASPASADCARAAVQAGGITTHYIRGGSGDLVVLLADVSASASADPLFGVLTASHRVVAPDPGWPKAGGVTELSFSTWIRGFLDGLGATDASIVARDGSALAALAFALTELDRVRRLVLCFRDAPDPLDPGGPLAEQLDDARCRILLVRETPAPEAHGEREVQYRTIVSFLQRGGPAG